MPIDMFAAPHNSHANCSQDNHFAYLTKQQNPTFPAKHPSERAGMVVAELTFE